MYDEPAAARLPPGEPAAATYRHRALYRRKRIYDRATSEYYYARARHDN